VLAPPAWHFGREIRDGARLRIARGGPTTISGLSVRGAAGAKPDRE
jgi:hypothetical protein